MEWAYVLVVILSIFLALFLLLGIVLVVLLIRVTIRIKSVTESAQRTAENIETIVAEASRFQFASMIAKTVFSKVGKFKGRRK